MSYRLSLAILGGLLVVGLSCDAPTAPDTGTLIVDVPALDASVALSGIRVTAIDPNGQSISRTAAPGSPIRFTHMDPGAYRVGVEGLSDGQTAYFGQTAGVVVTAGRDVAASVALADFRPAFVAPGSDTARVLHFGVVFTRVPGASSYVLAWSSSADMADAQTATLSDTTSTISVKRQGKYWLSVRAVNSLVPSGGASSAPIAVLVVQQVATVTIAPALPTIAFGGTRQLTATAKDASNATIKNLKWLWVSSDANVATVNQTGLVTAIDGGHATISAAAQGIPGSTTVTVSSQSRTKLAFLVQPANVTAGAAMPSPLQVEVQDASGNRVRSADNTVTLTIQTNPSSGTLLGARVAHAIDGIATFPGISIDKKGTGYRLGATASGLTSATSAAFTVTPGVATKLMWGVQPTAAVPDQPNPTTFTVKVTDAYGNVVTSATNHVVIGFGTNVWASPATVGATMQGGEQDAVSGVASFQYSAWIDRPGYGYRLAATSVGLDADTSDAFDVTLATSAVASGGSHACAISSLQIPFCWGSNSNGQLGYSSGTWPVDSVPRPIPVFLYLSALAGGDHHTCGLDQSHAAWCWGDNSRGQLGTGDNTGRVQASAVSGGLLFSSIAAGGNTTCGITTSSGDASVDRQVYCWGAGDQGEMGNGGTSDANQPTRVSDPLQATAHATQISVGGEHVCAAADDGNIYCWGMNASGQLGSGSTTNNIVPSAVSNLGTMGSVAAGTSHTCALDNTGAAFCWGSGVSGELGDGNSSDALLPVTVNTSTVFSALTAGSSFTCGIEVSTEAAWCWGKNDVGQLGNSGTVNAATPSQVSDGHLFTGISAGHRSVCAQASDGTWCWGSNAFGQMGNGTSGYNGYDSQYIPYPVHIMGYPL